MNQIKYLTDKKTKVELLNFETNSVKANIEILEGKEYVSEIDKELLYKLSGEEDKISKHNKETWKNGIKIQIPQDKNAIIKLQVNGENFTSHRKQIILEENSEATIIEENTSNTTTNSETTEIFLKENSKLNYITINNTDEKSNDFIIKHANLSKNSKIKYTNIIFGSKNTIQRTEINLEGENSTGEINDVFFEDEKQHYDVSSVITHSKKDTSSNINSKIALKGTSRCVYRPLIHIKENATNSDGIQAGKILMLSEDAKADPIPKLDIENNEVRCAHGVGITQINGEKLFYLESRGIEKEEGKKIITEGFFKNIIDSNIIDEELNKKISLEIIKKIKN